MNEQITKKVNQIIIEHLAVQEEKLSPEASFVNDLGTDSLDAMDLLIAINEEFHIRIPPERLDDIHTVNDMVVAVAEAIQARR